MELLAFQSAQEKLICCTEKWKLKQRQVRVQEALGQYLAEPLCAQQAHPFFSQSAMDGYAIRFQDWQTGVRVFFEKGRILAGDDLSNIERTDCLGCCYKIMTGAAMPMGFDTVIKIEEVEKKNNEIFFKKTPRLGQNVRMAGEDILKGKKLLSIGDRIQAMHLFPLLATENLFVKVWEPVRVLLLSTGSEILEDEKTPLKVGKIRNSSAATLGVYLRLCGCQVVEGGGVPDREEVFLKTFQKLIGEQGPFHIVVSTGAVSKGDVDFIPHALNILKAQTLFHGVRMRPGKPMFCALLKEGGVYFGLPGNPVSSLVGVRFFVLPLLRALRKQSAEQGVYLPYRGKPFQKPKGFRFFGRGKIVLKKGQCWVQSFQKQGSAQLESFLEAEHFWILPEEKEKVEEGMFVETVPIFQKPHRTETQGT